MRSVISFVAGGIRTVYLDTNAFILQERIKANTKTE